jgi:hypothetical protein
VNKTMKYQISRTRIAAATALCGLAMAAVTPAAHALGVLDMTGDFIASYTGPQGGDLDVVGSFVTYNPVTDMFVFAGIMNADIGTTPGSVYVWGVNRGAGAAGFAGIGIDNVFFDAIVRFSGDGSGTVTGTTPATQLPAGTAKVIGSTIIGQISGSLLPSQGFAKSDYSWNLWPRAAGIAGTAAISDFAPDNANLPVTTLSPVPEPASVALWLLGLAALAPALRKRAAH